MRILVVDDNPMNLKLAGLVLAGAGHEVDLVTSGQAALDHLADPLPDVAVVDIQMPGMDGLELVRRIRASRETTRMPIVALSAAVFPEDERRALAAGCDAFLPKPVDTRTFAQDVAAAAGGVR